MKLDTEPRIEAGPNFMFSLKEIFRRIAQTANPLVDYVAGLAGFAVGRSGTNGTAVTVSAVNAGNGDAILNLDKTGAAQLSAVNGSRGGLLRWRVSLGNSTTESGSDAGSDFAVNRYNDSGAFVAGAFTIRRTDGLVTIPGTLNVGPVNSGNLVVTGTVNTNSTVSASGSGTFNGTTISGAGAGLTTSTYGTSGTIVFSNVLTTTPAGFSNVLSSQHNPGVFAKWQFQVGGVNFDFKNDGHATCVSWDSTSDRRVKTNLVPITGALERVAMLTAYTGERLDVIDAFAPIPRRQAFLIAQDVLQALPEAVSVASDAIGTLSYEGAAVGALLVAAVNEQQALINSMRAEINILKGA